MKKELEVNRMVAVHEKSQAIGEFLEWLKSEKHLTVCERVENAKTVFFIENEDKCKNYDKEEGAYTPACLDTNKLLAEYFEIDLNKVEKERRKLLGAIRTIDKFQA